MKKSKNPDITKVYSPNSIYHGVPISHLSKQTLDNIEINRKIDFLEWLFDTHCNHISQVEAWKEFEEFEIENLK